MAKKSGAGLPSNKSEMGAVAKVAGGRVDSGGKRKK